MKRVLPVVLSVALLSMSLLGCTKDAKTTEQPATEEATPASEAEEPAAEEPAAETGAVDVSSLEPVTLKMWFHGSNVTDDSAVLTEVNKYLTEKLNCTLEPIWGTWADFDEKVPLAISGGDNVDIYFTCSWSADEYNAYARNGAWLRLDNPDNNLIEKYASDLWSQLPEVLTTGATVMGSDGLGVYGVPGWKDTAIQNCWDVNETLLEELGFTIADIEATDYYGFEPFLKAAKEKKGADFYPLLVEGAVLERMVNNTSIVTGDIIGSTAFAVLSYYFDAKDVTKPGPAGHKIQNKFATPEFKKFVEKTREYYLAGYIDPAMGLSDQANAVRTTKQNAAEYLIGTQSNSLGYELSQSEARGITVKMVPTSDPFTDTTSSQGALMAVSANSQNPERAVMFLNLLNTDPVLMTMLNYGIEGTHYTKNADGTITFDADMRALYSPWTNGVGNVNILPSQDVEGPTFRQDFKAFYDVAKSHPILGYAFDNTSVANETAAIAAVTGQYALALCAGTVDPATELPKFLDALEAAGMQKYLDEAQLQLDAFLAAQK